MLTRTLQKHSDVKSQTHTVVSYFSLCLHKSEPCYHVLGSAADNFTTACMSGTWTSGRHVYRCDNGKQQNNSRTSTGHVTVLCYRHLIYFLIKTKTVRIVLNKKLLVKLLERAFFFPWRIWYIIQAWFK